MVFQSSRAWSSLCLLLVLLAAAATQGQTPDTVLARVNDKAITLKEVDVSVAAQISPLQQQLYAIRKAALENIVTRRILESEAAGRGVTVAELRKQLTQGEIRVTDAQVEEAYKQNASFFASMSPDEARERLRLDLENQARMKNYRAGLEALRAKWSVTIDFSPPVFVSALDDGVSPARGSPNPQVTIVEFSDFECPFCNHVQSTLKQIIETYGKEVRLVFKHLPLEGHRNSFTAARAAYCAGEQDRFWQFHDALFSKRDLSSSVLEQIASDLGLATARFKECFNSEQSRAAIVKDLEVARTFRIDSTPSFIVNGKLIKGAISFADFQKIIEQELGRNVNQKQSSTN
ncbi:MAG TPA: thioredoxin domain-containing protein [Pyrinomonadaceae bacterium]|nr:thioredoxin domain-containing protein [Pyrinomonadaceae bacterium]